MSRECLDVTVVYLNSPFSGDLEQMNRQSRRWIGSTAFNYCYPSLHGRSLQLKFI